MTEPPNGGGQIQGPAARIEPPGGTSAPAPEISVVIPVYNESANLEELFTELVAVLESTSRSFEIIIVDDGSTDSTAEVLRALHHRDARLMVIRLRRNFGQTPAISAGFDASRGACIITMDGDLQNDPSDIPLLLDTLKEDIDIVSGWRIDRKDPLSRRFPSRVANLLIARVTGVALNDYGCTLKVYRRDVVKNVRLYGELHRVLPAAAGSLGIRVVEIPVQHRPRLRGQSKYEGWWGTTSRTTKVLLDILSLRFLQSYATRPLHVFGALGLLTSGVGFAVAGYLSFRKLFLGEPLAGRPLLSLAVLMMIVGVQFISLGLLGELVVRTYYESQGKPIYVIREILAIERERTSA